MMRAVTSAAAIATALSLGLPTGAAALAPVGPGVVGLWQAEGNAEDPWCASPAAVIGETRRYRMCTPGYHTKRTRPSRTVSASASAGQGSVKRERRSLQQKRRGSR
jgi:hypothetical protein